MNDKMLFLFDVDGTLIDTETHQIPLSTITALQQLHKQGHLLGISTGRSLPSLKNGGFASLIDWDFFLCNNGQAIFNKNKKSYISPVFLKRVLKSVCRWHMPNKILY